MARQEQSPIDGGYSYVIAVVVFLAHVLQYGFTWTMGVWYTVFMEQYNVGSKYVALISSLNTASFYAAGPLSSLLTNMLGARAVCILGSLIGCTGVITSMFASSVYALYVTFGLVAGFGFGLAYIPGVAMVGFYFEKRRSLAMGVAVSGCGIGTFIFPPIIALLIQTYGLAGALLNVGGLCLHLVVFGALYRPWKGDRNIEVEVDTDDDTKKEADVENNTETNVLVSEPARLNALLHMKPHLSTSKPSVLISRGSLFQSNASLKGSNATLNSLAIRRKLLGVPPNFCRTVSICDLQPGSVYSSKPCSMYGSKLSMTKSGLLRGSRSVLGSRSVIGGSIQLLNDQNNYVQIQDNDNEPSIHSEQDTKLQRTLLEKLNMDIFKEWSYLSLCLNNLLFCFGLSIVYVHMGSYAKETLQLSIQQSGHFFSAIGIANFFGRFAFGALCQVPFFKPICVYSVAFLLSGLVTLVCPLWDEYLWLMTYAVAFGFLSGSFGALLPSVIIQVTELEKLSSAYGYLLVFEALGTLFGAPLAGVLYDWTGVYKNSFYMGGFFMIGSALAMFHPMKYARSESEIQRALSCDLDEQFDEVAENQNTENIDLNQNEPVGTREKTPLTEESSLDE